MQQNILIVTQKVDINDDILGFFHGWILEFAKNYEKVTVICLEKGDYDLPVNVKVLSLGKEKLKTKNYKLKTLNQLKYIIRFYYLIWKKRKEYNKVFIHMNQIYMILGGLFWRLWGKKVGLWYAHGSVPFSLRIATFFTNIIFTSTESGFRLKSKKKKVIGQGIDTNIFKSLDNKGISPTFSEEKIDDGQEEKKEIFEIISVGRISPVKDYETTIEAIEILHKKGIKLKLNIIGGVGLLSQKNYLNNLKEMVERKRLNDIIKFKGSVANNNILSFLQESDLYINTSHTGSLDKAVLEAMATGLLILTCNESLDDVLGEYKEKLTFPKKNSVELANKIESIMKMDIFDRIIFGQKLREIVIKDHNLESFIKKIVEVFK